MVAWTLPTDLLGWIAHLAHPLHARSAGRLLPLLRGLLFAQGRRTVASWLRAAGLGKEFRQCYHFLGSLGHKVEWVASLLLRRVVEVVAPGPRLLFALDDTPTKRYGPCVEGAGIHHNPTPGPAEQKFLYGHVWVTLALVVRHPLWGAIALPLRALLYVRAKDIGRLPRWYRVVFQTKLQMAATLVGWVASWLKYLGKTLWVVADGAYAKRPFLRAAARAGIVVVSRLRKDAALRSVLPTPQPGAARGRGRPRKYGAQKVSLAKRAGHRQGWQTLEFLLYGQKVLKTFKTFLATYPPAGGLIRVVLVKETDGWVAFFCTNPEASVAEILEAVADRSALEQVFHDVKEVHGTGQQQVRYYWSNIAVYHLTLWLHTLIEMWAWYKPARQLVDRRCSPWDDAERRPSHADRRNALRRWCLQLELKATGHRRPLTRKIQTLCRCLLKLVT